MAEKLRIFPLLSSQLQFSVSQPIFEPLATQVLGNAATNSDGFNAELLAVAQQLESDAALVLAGDSDLAAADFKAGEFAASNIDPLIQETGVFNSGGDSLLQQLGDTAQIPTSQPAPANPCGPVQGNFSRPPCNTARTITDTGIDLGTVQVGQCKLQYTYKFLFDQGNQLYIASVSFRKRDAAFLAVDWHRNSEDDIVPQQQVIITYDASKLGHFEALVDVHGRKTGQLFAIYVCLDIVDSATLSSNAQAQLLPIRG